MYDTVCKSNAEFSMLSERDKFIVLMTSQEKGIVYCLAKYICMSAKLKEINVSNN